jgi:putative DNA primase/helicase
MTEIHQTYRTIAMTRLPLDAEIRAKDIVARHARRMPLPSA